MANPIEERAEKALLYLAKTDDEDAGLRLEMAKAEHRYKLTLAAIYDSLGGEGLTIKDRESKSLMDERSKIAYDDFLTAQREFNAVHNKRESEKCALEWCRSLNANRRMGG